MRAVLSIFVIYTIACAVNGNRDFSPYCGGLAKITNLCTDYMKFVLCPNICGSAPGKIKMECGIRKYGDVHFAKSKKKQNDDFDGEEIHSRVRRIIGGKATVKGSYPWHVALHFAGSQRCAGAVLSPDWILTAAHCFNSHTTSKNENNWLVFAGKHRLSTSDKGEQLSQVKKIIIHKFHHKYRKDVPDDYDIALLKLKTPLVFNDHSIISPMCLPDLGMKFTSRDLCKTMGWGATVAQGSQQMILHDASVKLVPRDICNLPLANNHTVHTRARCAGYKNGHAAACKYDSGGSLACKRGKRWYGVGLVSSGNSCGTKSHKYGVYTDLNFLREWIVRTILCYDDAANAVVPFCEHIVMAGVSHGDFEKREGKKL